MTDHRDQLEDFEPSLPERNKEHRDDRVRQIIAEIRAFLRGEGA